MNARSRTRLRQARTFVVAACRRTSTTEELEKLGTGIDVELLIDAVGYHRVAAAVHERIAEIDTVPNGARTELREMHAAAQATRLYAQRALRGLEHALDVPFIVAKGPVLASHWYSRSSTREFSDVDVLVEPQNFDAALASLTSAGFESLTTNWHGFRDHRVAEVPLRYESTTVDLHWDLVAIGVTRDQIRVPARPLFERAVVVRVGESDVLTLDPVDTLLHVCVNTGLDGARRLRGLLDVDTLVHGGRVDLGELPERAGPAGAGRLCAAVLQRTQRVLGTELPEGFLADLSPTRTWLFANDLIDRGPRHTRQAGVASGVLLSAGRRDSAATLSALASGLRAAAVQRSGSPGVTDPGGELDWQRRPADGDLESHRRRYLDFVAAADRSIARRRCSEVGELHRRIGALQPRTTPMLGAAFLEDLDGRRARADLFEFGDGTLAAATLRYRWTIGHTTAYTLLLDASAARSVGEFIERSSVTDLSGSESDTEPLHPFLPRWRVVSATTPASLPPGFVWPEVPTGVRPATMADLDVLVEAFWRYSPHAYPNRWLLRRRLRRAIAQLVLVVEDGEPPRPVGFGVLDSTTPEYDYWAQVVITPEFRERGLSWTLVAAGASRAAARGVGAMVCVVDSNPMSIPDDSTADEAWNFVELRPPRRVRGEARLRSWLEWTLALPSCRGLQDEPAPVAHRTPGGTDELVTERRTQRWWRAQLSSERDEGGAP